MITVAHDDSPTTDATLRSISSNVLGDVDVSNDAVIAFPTPLFGFPNHNEFALLPATRDGLWWLQSMNDGAVTFLLADPFVLDPDYGVDVGETEKAFLHIDQPADVLGLVMITLPMDGGDSATGNFRAPLVINVARRIGMQVVGREEKEDLRRPVSLDVYPSRGDSAALQ